MKLRGPFRAIWHFNATNDTKKLEAEQKKFKGRTVEAASHIHAVNYIHQGHFNLCGDACVEMLRRFYGDNPLRATTTNSKKVESLSTNPRGIFKGLSLKKVYEEADHSSFKLSELQFPDSSVPKEELVKSLTELISEAPILLSYRENNFYGHYALLIGIIGDKLVVHDPWSGGSEIESVEWLLSLLSEHELEGFLAQDKAADDIFPTGIITIKVDSEDSESSEPPESTEDLDSLLARVKERLKRQA
ncbi:C39 family peptidase [Endozoicomonas sp. SESOKO4]|uniref:C39 family peptidase n=1 Tax=Endozoicomonas sp. SESOKO4 TaxID=2828745 RepID=UPI002148BEFC|nr:papain-like cysteine protease family protein [Endozoicomonas sp. SESOKO4]